MRSPDELEVGRRNVLDLLHRFQERVLLEGETVRDLILLLEGVGPMLGTRPQPNGASSREAVEQVVRRIYIDAGSPLEHAQEDAREVVAALFAAGVVRPLPTREQVAREVHRGYQAALCNSDVPGWTLSGEATEVADRVLALLTGGEE